MGYTKREVAERTGRRTNTINYYVNEGIIIPDIEPQAGRGKPMVFSDRNLVEIKMIEHMARMGVSLGVAQIALGILRKGSWYPGDILLEMHDSAEAALKRIKKETVSFNDFWKSSKWGGLKEVVFLDMRTITDNDEQAFEHWVEVVERKSLKQGFKIKRAFDPTASVATILWLGSIKEAAKKQVLTDN